MDYGFLSETVLFYGTPPQELKTMLNCLGAKQKRYARGEIIAHAGEPVQNMGLLLFGRVQIESDDLWGNKSVLDSIGPGLTFAETYACVPGEPMMVSAVAAECLEVLFLNAMRILETCSLACEHHSRLIRNLLTLTAQKNLTLSRRIFYTSSKSIRGRLMSYLSDQASRFKSRAFTIPFNRQQLADYLSVDRSALSNELSKMRREGLLETDKNYFLLKEDFYR